MNRFLIALLLTLAGSANAAQPEKFIDVQHDSLRSVTCWILNDKAISCLPDSSLLQAIPSSESGRASPANSGYKNAPLQAIPEKVNKR